MSRQPKSLIASILIICEGEKTEPLYFKGLNDELVREDIWQGDLKLTIVPEPSADDADDEETKEQHLARTGRKQRSVKTSRSGPEPILLSGNSPLQLTTKGIQELDTFDRVFVVFDKDNHADHEAAFKKAEETFQGKTVEIIFSSRSFETWVLFHFEMDKKAYDLTQCFTKTFGKRRYTECGTDCPDDCGGTKCIVGSIVKNHSYEYTKNTDSVYNDLKDKLPFATVSATLSRHYSSHIEPIYNRNPYTDLDQLVNFLLRTREETVVLSSTTPFVTSKVRLEVSPESQVNYTNISDTTSISNFSWNDETRRMVLEVGDSDSVLTLGEDIVELKLDGYIIIILP